MKKYNITVNGNTYEVYVEEADGGYTAPVAPAPVVAAPTAAPAPAAKPAAAPKASAPAAPAGATKVTAPMPGTILQIKVSQGQSVKKGDVICVLEAMKMENDIPAPCDGVVASINVQKGASVNAGDVIASIN
jgi:biotin carboxyl carrier protein